MFGIHKVCIVNIHCFYLCTVTPHTHTHTHTHTCRPASGIAIWMQLWKSIQWDHRTMRVNLSLKADPNRLKHCKLLIYCVSPFNVFHFSECFYRRSTDCVYYHNTMWHYNCLLLLHSQQLTPCDITLYSSLLLMNRGWGWFLRKYAAKAINLDWEKRILC